MQRVILFTDDVALSLMAQQVCQCLPTASLVALPPGGVKSILRSTIGGPFKVRPTLLVTFECAGKIQ